VRCTRGSRLLIRWKSKFDQMADHAAQCVALTAQLEDGLQW